MLFAVFGVIPLVVAAYLSTHKWDGIGPMSFVGFRQYARLFDDTQFRHAMLTTLSACCLSEHGV